MPQTSVEKKHKLCAELNAKHGATAQLNYLQSHAFGSGALLDHYRMANGLELLLLEDPSAPVVAFHAWFRVGSRHEKPGKTGLAHLFEHLMFNEIEGMPAGAFDKKMEAAGADNNASTWLDFTQYQEAFPKQHLKTVIELEAARMNRLVLRTPQVTSEKEVVKNERAYRVDDDVEGAVEELLWKTAFEKHPYHWPTIGWMQDIEGFTIEDCEEFYRRFYAPNNATLVLVGDFKSKQALQLIAAHYGVIPASQLPLEDSQPEPPQIAERRLTVHKPTPTEKLVVGYKGPAIGDADHIAASLLLEILTGGQASRLRKRLVRTEELASDVSGFVGPHVDPSLIEFSISARSGKSADELLRILDEELSALIDTPVSEDEVERAKSRTELMLWSSMETADGKASSIGFYQTVAHRPAAAFERMASLQHIGPAELRRVARRYLRNESRTVILVKPSGETSDSEEQGAAPAPAEAQA